MFSNISRRPILEASPARSARFLAYLALLAATLALGGCETPVVQPEKTPAAANVLPGVNAQLAALQELQSAFHGAIRNQDDDLLRSLWTEDATFEAGIGSATGPAAIADLIAGSGVYGMASLAPSYKTQFEIHGNTAEFAFECVLLPETGNLTGQEVVGHVNATGTMRKVGKRWLFSELQGGVGPLP